jgi:ribosomal protein S18 acetylase RimI-like enzyme
MARRGTTWLACRGVQPVGFAVVRSAGRGAVELCAIAVAIEERGLGVGAELLAEVEHRLAVEGGGRLGIHTAQANLAAMDLFLKHGFQVERRLAGYYRGVFDACAMHKQVARVRP